MRICDICDKPGPVSTLFLKLEYPCGDNAVEWTGDVCNECHEKFRAGLIEWVNRRLRLPSS